MSSLPTGQPAAVSPPRQEDLHIDVDTRGDSDYEEDSASDTTSLASTLLRFPIDEYGRSYHKFREGKYKFPNDADEQNREDMKHALIVNYICEDTMYYAPIGDNPQAILDLGPGTGIWTIDIADKFPSATVTGIDLSPIQPSWVPPNLNFIIDDLEDPDAIWGPRHDHFDYIHARHMVLAFMDWPRTLRKCFDYLKPGGWVEFQELGYYPRCDDGTMVNYPWQIWVDLVKEAYAELRKKTPQVDIFIASKLGDMLKEAGFVNVTEVVLKVPLGTWPRNRRLKMAGAFFREIALEINAPLSRMTLGPGLGWSREEIEAYLVNVRKSLRDPSYHVYVDLHIVYAQKPMSA